MLNLHVALEESSLFSRSHSTNFVSGTETSVRFFLVKHRTKSSSYNLPYFPQTKIIVNIIIFHAVVDAGVLTVVSTIALLDIGT